MPGPFSRKNPYTIILTTALLIQSTFSQAADSTLPASMVTAVDGYKTVPLLTIGETIGANGNSYSPPGSLDGIGAFQLTPNTIRVIVNHELGDKAGYEYMINNGRGKNFKMSGARISYLDIDKSSRKISRGGLAYDRIYDANGAVVTGNEFLPDNAIGFSRFCSGSLFAANSFHDKSGKPSGLRDTIYFAGEENGGKASPVGGDIWALDVNNKALWHIPALGHGAWENIALLDSGDSDRVAILLNDDTAPFDVDDDGMNEMAPLYLYIGKKDPAGDFPARNGLRGGSLYVWTSDTGEQSAMDFNTSGSLNGHWRRIDNRQNLNRSSQTGVTGYDKFGYPTQRTLWKRASDAGAFGFSRPEDVSTNPENAHAAAFVSTGIRSSEKDTFGTVYLVKTNFEDLSATLTILYNGDSDPARALRSPDNVSWSKDGYIYIQEDMAVYKTKSGENLFGPNAINKNEAGIVQLDPRTGMIKRIANINRDVVLDASIDHPDSATDRLAGQAGRWETSGILDVSNLFEEKPGTLFLFDVQAHGIANQKFPSRIKYDDLVEGGQLLFLEKDKN